VSRGARLALLLVVVLPLVITPEAGAAPYAPIPNCSPGPADCSGWHTSNVSITWQYEGGFTNITCNSLPVTSDTSGVQRTCSVAYDAEGQNPYSRTVTIKLDKTPPQVTAATPERAPDSDGWYNRPVAVAFTATDATSGLASCDRPTYAFDSATAQVTGTCRDTAGNTSAPASAGLKYDATPPTVTAVADRAPDANGWYRKPLTVAFNGADAISGIQACTQPARYAGPDRAQASLAGTCRDHAGNTAGEVTFTANYDATAPKLAAVEATVGKGVARLDWRKPVDAVLVRIDRTPGVNGAKKTRVYRGNGQAFVDRTVHKGVRYRYDLTAADAAGNVAAIAVIADARPALYAPLAGAVVRAPIRLAWDAVPRARYYNVQLFRNGVKILSAWPRRPWFRLPRTWRYLGKQQALEPGLHRWFVWPALGTRAQPRFGRPLGSSTFRIKAG